ncbi:uncharacterized protein C8R40DRAFT_710432 [Lentinula edodes]|uniref:uncharacterized protein n=1 Tax=Lentinula edodes TaxID=5353 RepID=UPI001E8D3A4D|nr:uncharacterized protein C8R40DRAFT_710432 [Lentinula edodes]KAH7869770.1 hypothetical protein C8R40DRAFT_710432 [Lentinula edodes]
MVSRPKKKARVEVEEEEEEEEEDEEEEYQVEYLKGAKVDDDGEWRYLVKWHGYDEPKHDTWEPEEHIANCQRLLASFWQEIGTDDKDYDPGYQCAPSEAWISLYFLRSPSEMDLMVSHREGKGPVRSRQPRYEE